MSSEEEKKKEEWIEKTEVEELKVIGEYLLPKVSELIGKLSESLKEIIDVVMSSIDGKKLAQEIGELYTGLKQAGLPEDMIKEIIREFYKKKLETAPTLTDILRNITRFVSKRAVAVEEEEEEEEEEEAKSSEKK